MEGLGNKKFHENHALILYYPNAGVKALATCSVLNEPATLCRAPAEPYARTIIIQAGQIGHSAIPEGLSNQLVQLAGVIDQLIIDGRFEVAQMSNTLRVRNNEVTIP